MKMKLFSISFLVMTLCAGAWYGTWNHFVPGPAGAYSASAADADGSEERWVQGVGYVEPASEVRRLVFKVDGVIAECRVQVGAHFKKGDILMVLNNQEQKEALALAECELALARAEQAKALSGAHPDEIAAARSKAAVLEERIRYLRGEYERTRRTFERRAASHSEYEKARTELEQEEKSLAHARAELRRLEHLVRAEDRKLEQARVERAQASLRVAKQRFQDTFLVAPMDGTVLEILKREGEGQRLIDKEPVLLIADMSRLRIRAEIDERYARHLQVGQQAWAFGRGLGHESFPGRVAEVRQQMGPKTVFSQAAGERRDLDVLQIILDMNEGFAAPLGLQVNIKLRLADKDVPQAKRSRAEK
jgi:multidrug resistance efflux pump